MTPECYPEPPAAADEAATSLGSLERRRATLASKCTGHADLIRESVDGRTGEDPPGTAYPYRLPAAEG